MQSDRWRNHGNRRRPRWNKGRRQSLSQTSKSARELARRFGCTFGRCGVWKNVCTHRAVLPSWIPVMARRPHRMAQVVAITFTERAAREMRHRIRRAKCLLRLQQSPPEQGDYWLGLLRSLDWHGSAPSTRFAARCYAATQSRQLDPRFAVMEPAQAETLLSELIDDLLREKLAARDPSVLELIVVFGLPAVHSAMAELFDRLVDAIITTGSHCLPNKLCPAGVTSTAIKPCQNHCAAWIADSAWAALANCGLGHSFANRKVADRCNALLGLLSGLPTSIRVAADLEAVREQAGRRNQEGGLAG